MSNTCRHIKRISFVVEMTNRLEFCRKCNRYHIFVSVFCSVVLEMMMSEIQKQPLVCDYINIPWHRKRIKYIYFWRARTRPTFHVKQKSRFSQHIDNIVYVHIGVLKIICLMFLKNTHNFRWTHKKPAQRTRPRETKSPYQNIHYTCVCVCVCARCDAVFKKLSPVQIYMQTRTREVTHLCVHSTPLIKKRYM